MLSRVEPKKYEPQLGALLRLAWERLQIELYDALADEGFDDLRPVHRPLVRYPSVDGLRPSEVADQLRLSRQAVNDLLRELEALGYLRLEPDPDDGRARIIRYTERGWHLFDVSSRISGEVGERWATHIGRRSYDGMLRALRAVQRLPPPTDDRDAPPLDPPVRARRRPG
jgi:DNA-binding MarR family transcriptional regulator